MATKGVRRRKDLKAIYGAMYSFRFFGDDRNKCVYCGDVREEIDHVPPMTVVEQLGVKGCAKLDVELIDVPSCRACNSALGARPLLTLEDRLDFLYGFMLRKADKGVYWTTDEINELKGELKRQVEAKQKLLRNNVLRRFRVIEERLATVNEWLAKINKNK